MDDVGSYSLCSPLQASKPFPSPEFRTILLVGCVGYKRTQSRRRIFQQSHRCSRDRLRQLCSPKTAIQGTRRFLCEATHVLTTILCCRAAQVRAVRMSSPNLASMNVRTLWVHSPKSWSEVPFKVKGCPIPFVSTKALPRSVRIDPTL